MKKNIKKNVYVCVTEPLSSTAEVNTAWEIKLHFNLKKKDKK